MDSDEWLHIIKLLRAGEFGAAEGGRVPMFGGGPAWKLWQEFIKKLFLKSSNEIRLNKKGLTQGQWIKKHDNLTKKLKEWEMGGKKSLPKDMKEYFGMNEIQVNNKFKIETGQIQTREKAGVVDEFLGLMKKEEKNLDEIEKLSSFDVTGRKPNATGGRVSLSAGGLAGMLGE